MHSRIRIAIRSLLSVVTVLSLTGCCLLSSLPQQKPSEEEYAARAEITKNRTYAESMVSTIKDEFKGKEAEKAYIDAKNLYNKAMDENNIWLSLLASSIENNENPAELKPFKERARAASDAANSFLAYGKQLTVPLTTKTADVRLTSFQPVTDLISALVNNGIIIWKENMARQAKERKDRAASIKRDLTWKKWKQIK